MKKLRLIESIVIFVMVLALLTTGIFAWIIARFQSDPVIFTSGSITLNAQLYTANDANKDGVLDGGFTEITAAGIDFENLMPGQVYTFRLIIENTGTADGHLDITVKDILPTNIALFNLLTIDFIHPTTLINTSLDLNSSNVVLFSNYVLTYEGTLTFDFTIQVEPTINNTLHGESITLGYFEVRLDQIP